MRKTFPAVKVGLNQHWEKGACSTNFFYPLIFSLLLFDESSTIKGAV